MTPEEAQRRIRILEGQIQSLTKTSANLQGQVAQKNAAQSTDATPKATMLGALPASLKAILNWGFEWVGNLVNVKAATNAGITVDVNGVSVQVEANKGLSVGANGLATVLKAAGGLGVDANGLYIAALTGLEKSVDPDAPAEGAFVIWMSDGSGKGDDGDVLIAATAGGATMWATLFDHSAGTPW